MKRWIAGALLGVIGAGMVWRFWPGDERFIRSHLDGLARAVSIAPGQSQLARMAGAGRVAEFFTPDVVFQIEGVDLAIDDRNGLREAVLASRTRFQLIELRLVDVHVRFPDGRDQAIAYASAVAHLDGQTNVFARPLKFGLRKADGRWAINRVETIAGVE